MAKRPIIRIGDLTTHGGTVVSADPIYSIYGKNVARVGDIVMCPRCKGAFPIVSGASDVISGQNVARQGDHTACGATLIASQGTATIDDCSEGSEDLEGSAFGTDSRDTSALSEDQTAYDEQLQLVASPIEGVPYYVEMRDGRSFSGRIGTDGLLPRIDTYSEDEYVVFWGDDALAKMGGQET